MTQTVNLGLSQEHWRIGTDPETFSTWMGDAKAREVKVVLLGDTGVGKVTWRAAPRRSVAAVACC